ncbi:MAG: Smr/MutS family protein [Pseudomonadota bacterium]
MSRKPRADELRLWGHVAATVRPLPGRAAPAPEPGPPPPSPSPRPPAAVSAGRKGPPGPPQTLEPGRQRRIERGRQPLGARIDLHGMTWDGARAALEAFLLRAWNEGLREVLVITGKGTRGDGVLRRATPDWLAAPPLRDIVAGVSEAHRRHGGQGALYVALRRKTPG